MADRGFTTTINPAHCSPEDMAHGQGGTSSQPTQERPQPMPPTSDGGLSSGVKMRGGS